MLSERPWKDPRPVLDRLSSSLQLLREAQRGDRDALDRLFGRLLPTLAKWARGRLPRWARDYADTADIVQETLIGTFRRLQNFEPRHRGALQAYLRQAIRNRIRDEIRRAERRPPTVVVQSDAAVDLDSPLKGLLRDEKVERYASALARLPEDDRELIVARMELGFSYEQVALAMRKPTAASARVAIRRALLRLAREIAGG